MSLLQKFLRVLRARGLSGALIRTLTYLAPEHVFSAKRGVMMVNDLTALQRPNANTTIRFTWTSVKDAGPLITLSGNGENIEKWSSSNYEVVVAEDDGHWAGYELYFLPSDGTETYALFQQEWLRVHLEEHQSWCVFTYIEPAYRRQGIASDIVSFASLRLCEDGYGQAFGCVETFNEAANRAHMKRGYRAVDRFVFLRICGLKVVRCGAKYRFGFWNADRPLVLVAEDVWA